MPDPQGGCHIVAFGAHAGDVDFTMAHVLAKYARHGHKATIVHVTLGEAGNARMSRQDYAEQRKVEIRESARVYGTDVRCLPYPDGELPATPESELALCDLIRELRPDIVLTHWVGSFHQDHVRTHHLVTRGVLLARLPGVKRALPPHAVRSLYYAENWEDPQDFAPEVYVDITEVFDLWLEGAGKHALFRGGVSTFPYQPYYTALAAVRGAESGCKYAAAYMRDREILKRASAFFP
jgi:LmbE family N-acetylglucosaminyl deacetylase